MAAVGVDGVNIHTLPEAAYEPFSFTKTGRTWRAFVHPVYYGLLMFAQAFPPGATAAGHRPGGAVKIWATQASDGTTRVVAINKSTDTPVRCSSSFPARRRSPAPSRCSRRASARPPASRSAARRSARGPRPARSRGSRSSPRSPRIHGRELHGPAAAGERGPADPLECAGRCVTAGERGSGRRSVPADRRPKGRNREGEGGGNGDGLSQEEGVLVVGGGRGESLRGSRWEV